ncbi:MAG: MFS transporter [Hamadaea sp.]|nr:MFS transporter [Hamadaea sp.]
MSSKLGGRDFALFWAVETLSTFGSSFSVIAVPLMVLHATGSVTQMGLLTGALGAATLVSGFFAGVVADRFDRMRLLIMCNVAQAVLFGIVPLVWLFASPIWLLYVVVPLTGAFAMLFRVTYVTVVPRLVDADQLTRANGRLSASFAASQVIGPILAGVVSGRFGPSVAIAVDAATFVLASIGLLFVRLRVQAPAEEHAVPARMSFWAEFSGGARFLWRHPVLRSMLVLLTMMIFFWQGLVDVVIFYLKHDLGQPDRTVGYVMAVAALGTVAGALVVARVRRLIGFGVTWIGSTMLAGLCVAAIAFTHSVPGVAVFTTLAFGCTAIGGICSMSLRQEITPSALLGRVTSAWWTIHFSLGPIGAAVVTASAERFGVALVIGVAGLAYLLISAIGFLTPIRQPHPERLAVDAV